MSHELQKDDTMFSANEKPWHGLGKVVEGAKTAEEAIDLAGLNWTVEKGPIYVPNADNTEVERVPNYGSIMRMTDRKVLGVVKSGYQPIQNKDMFTFFDSIVDKGEAIYHTAGSLFGGRRVWVLAKLQDAGIVVKNPNGKGFDDIVEEYVLVTNTHDGTMSYMILPTNIRVVCNNTLSWSLTQAFQALAKEDDPDKQNRIMYTIKHTANAQDRIKQAAEVMGYTSRINAELNEAYNAMAAKMLTDDERLDFFQRCLAITPKDTKDAGGDGDDQDDEKTPRRIVRLEELHEQGLGAEYTRGSLWGAYNAVTELVDHNPQRRSQDSRLENAWFGGDKAIKNRAFALAKDLVTA